MRRALVRTILAVAMTAGGTAAAEDESSPAQQAENFLQRGLELFHDEQYDLAIVEFRSGYALDPRPEFLFALAQAERLSGDCESALGYYGRFLSTDPASNQGEVARINAKRCRRALESGPGDDFPGDPGDVAADPDEAAADPEDSERISEAASVSTQGGTSEDPPRWYRDYVEVSLLVGGAAGLGVGAWSFRGAMAEADAAEDADSYLAYADHMDRARTRRNLAWVSAGIGTAALAGAIVRAATRSGSGPSRERPVALVAPTERGAVVGLLGRF